MFTGIVEAVGRISSIKPLGDDKAGVRLEIMAGKLPLEAIQLGDSIAVNGACMTVIHIDRSDQFFYIDVSRESLSKTAGLDKPGFVNLERAVTTIGRLDGHIVSGHVDETGVIEIMEPAGESMRLVISAPKSLARYLAYKGSVAVNGVSLTINEVLDTDEDVKISINLIPHTMSVTTFCEAKEGDRVNLEIDLIARYVERVLSVGAPVKAKKEKKKPAKKGKKK